jgi:hypothetical protein
MSDLIDKAKQLGISHFTVHDFVNEIEALRRQLSDEKLCHAETRERLNEVATDWQVVHQRIEELEAVIKSHGIAVKTATGGVAHYCTKETLLDAHASMVEREEYDDLNKEIARLSKIEDVALEVVTAEFWSGEEFYDRLCKLRDVLGES